MAKVRIEIDNDEIEDALKNNDGKIKVELELYLKKKIEHNLKDLEKIKRKIGLRG